MTEGYALAGHRDLAPAGRRTLRLPRRDARRTRHPSPPHAEAESAPAIAVGDRRTGAADGFTLVELLVVLAILSLAVTAGSHTLLGATMDRRAAQTADALAAEIGRLRAEALRSGNRGRLVYEPGAGRFLSSRPGAAAIATAGLRVSLETPPSDRPVPGEIRLLPDGGSTGGRIVLAGRTSSVVLTLAPLTGRVAREEIR